MPPKAILFDAVGTLLHAEPDVASVYAAAGRKHGSELTRDEIWHRFRSAFAEVFAGGDGKQAAADHQADRRRWQAVVARVFRELPDSGELFEELWHHFALAAAWRLYPDAERAWQQAEQRGLLVGVASNYDDRLLSVIRGLPLLAECPWVFHSAGLGYAKPDERFFQAIERRLDLAPDELMLEGDDWQNDYQGATAVGWQAAYLNRSGQSSAQYGPEVRVIRRLTDLWNDDQQV